MEHHMFKVRSAILVVAVLLGVSKGFAQQAKGVEEVKNIQTVKTATKMLVMADYFRTQAMTNTTLAFSRLSTAACAKKWTDELASKVDDKRDMVFADFFAGAVVFMGALTTEKSVVGFYNPWSDAILLGALRSQGDGPAAMEDFLLVTGESFRNTPIKSADLLLALYRPEKPLMIELATRVEKTESLFNSRYPLNCEAPLLVPELKASMHPQSVECAYFLARQSYRMTLFAQLTQQEKRPLFLQMGQLLRALGGDMKTLDKTVSAQQRPAALENIKLLPVALRKNLAPHYVIQAKDGAIIGFVNPEFPRWVVIANLKGVPTAERDATLEAFDLLTSKGLVALLNGGK
jgi:hypothetical protein